MEGCGGNVVVKKPLEEGFNHIGDRQAFNLLGRGSGSEKLLIFMIFCDKIQIKFCERSPL